jgi:hypothetical protein
MTIAREVELGSSGGRGERQAGLRYKLMERSAQERASLALPEVKRENTLWDFPREFARGKGGDR